MFAIEKLIGLQSSSSTTSETNQPKITSNVNVDVVANSFHCKKLTSDGDERRSAIGTVSSGGGDICSTIGATLVSPTTVKPTYSFAQPVPNLLSSVQQHFPQYPQTVPWWLLHTPIPYDLALMTRK